MKLVIAAGGLALASLTVPQIALAQSDAPQRTIIVKPENQRDWDRGNELEAKGMRDLQEANRELAKHSAAVVAAQETRDISRRRAEISRQTFESLTARPFFSDPKDAHRWAKQVEEAANDWERFTKRGDSAERDLRRAQRHQQQAQERVDKAQLRIDEGRAMKVAAERASVGSGTR